MDLTWKPVGNLTLGVNYRNLVASRTSRPGEAQDCLDMLPREDGAIYKTFGWERLTDSALNGVPVAQQGFTYRGKNIPGGTTARPGNLGLANSGADFTRRQEEYPGYIFLTDTDAYTWDPVTETFITLTIPGGVSIMTGSKPVIQVVQDNAYIVGWTDFNLRYDPVDRAFYRWGWEAVPGTGPVLGSIAGTLVANATYQYAVSFLDIYTGEESKMGPLTSITIGASPSGVSVDVSAITYAGTRKFNVGPGTADSDVATVIWRTSADGEDPRFLAILNPGVTSFLDDGVAREASLKPYRGIQQDEPTFSAIKEFKGRFYALSELSNSNRVYFSSFNKNSFFERWEPLNFRDLPVPDGEVLTAVGGTDSTLLVYGQRGAFRGVISTAGQTQSINFQRLPWYVGCVGPAARRTVDGYDYFLSERGPARWREGIAKPQEIGENLLPQFVDPNSGICQLTELVKNLSEVEFDWQAQCVRFIYPIGPDAVRPNTHMAYWISADRVNGDYRLGWFPQSPQIQCMTMTSAIVGIDPDDGFPFSPREVLQSLVWADESGYIYSYGMDLTRGGLLAGEVATGEIDTGSTPTVINTKDTLYTTGDGMTGLRVEVESVPDSSGNTTTEVRQVVSNTGTSITLDTPLSFIPAEGATWNVAGIPSFWRSWFDHLGSPHDSKTLMDFSLGYQDRGANQSFINVNIGAGEFPDDFRRFRTANLDRYRRKMTASLTAVYFMYEFSNSKPDQSFLVTDFDREVAMVPGRRRA